MGGGQSGAESGNEGGKGKGKKGKAKAKAKAKGKADPKKAKSAPAEADAQAMAVELQQLKSRALFCTLYQKGKCTKGDDCLFAHVGADDANEIKRASKAYAKHAAAKRSASAER